MTNCKRLCALVVGVVLCAALAGCSPREEPMPELFPLSGVIARDGATVAGGGLYFAPDPAGNSPLIVNASVRPDGTFAAETIRTERSGKTETRPGAPAGKYKVIYHPPSDGSKTGLEVTLAEPITVGPGGPPLALALPKDMPAGNGAQRDDAPPKP